MALQFVFEDYMPVVFAQYIVCVWNWMLWINLRTIVLPRYFLPVLLRWFNGLWKSCFSWVILSKAVPIFFYEFSRFRVGCKSKVGHYMSNYYESVFFSDSETNFMEKERMQPFLHFSVVLYSLTTLHNRRSMSSDFLVFQTSKSISWSFLIFKYFSDSPSLT